MHLLWYILIQAQFAWEVKEDGGVAGTAEQL